MEYDAAQLPVLAVPAVTQTLFLASQQQRLNQAGQQPPRRDVSLISVDLGALGPIPQWPGRVSPNGVAAVEEDGGCSRSVVTTDLNTLLTALHVKIGDYLGERTRTGRPAEAVRR